MATPPLVNAPGDASLNAADRLAIINLFGAYAQNGVGPTADGVYERIRP